MNICIMIDGTGNGGVFSSVTNVQKLFKCAEENSLQHCKYFSGPGTIPKRQFEKSFKRRQGKAIRKVVRRAVTGYLYGSDVLRILTVVYTRFAEWYCLEHRIANLSASAVFEDGWAEGLEAPKIFLFGFSRGAFIARKLADLITKCGIPANGGVAKEIVRAYRRGYTNCIDAKRCEKKLTKPLTVAYMGLWDTVNSTGRYFNGKSFYAHGVESVRHAIAKHEYRQYYRLFPLYGDNVESRIFPGDHCDVGGGHRNGRLSELSLAWIAEGAVEKGFLVQDEFINNQQVDLCKAHLHNKSNSATNLFGIIGTYDRKLCSYQEHPMCAIVEDIHRECCGDTIHHVCQRKYRKETVKAILRGVRRFVRKMLNSDEPIFWD